MSIYLTPAISFMLFAILHLCQPVIPCHPKETTTESHSRLVFLCINYLAQKCQWFWLLAICWSLLVSNKQMWTLLLLSFHPAIVIRVCFLFKIFSFHLILVHFIKNSFGNIHFSWIVHVYQLKHILQQWADWSRQSNWIW